MSTRRPPVRRRRARGATTVEFALASVLFCVLMFGLVEFARVLFLLNTVQEVTRRAARAAAVADFSDPAALAQLRRAAVFSDTDGKLMLGGDIGHDHVRIEYLRGDGVTPLAAGLMPPCPPLNVRNCARDPDGADCIRFVRASLCRPAAGPCQPAAIQAMLPGLLPGLALNLPTAATVVRAEALGYRPGMALCL